MPSVSYDALNQSVNVGINLNSFANYSQQKKRNQIEREKLRINGLQSITNQVITLSNQIQKYRLDSIAILDDENNVELWRQLHEIKTAEYQHNTITLVTYNQFLMRYNTAINAVKRKKLQVAIQRKNLVQILSQ